MADKIYPNDALEQEAGILDIFRNHGTKNPKKVKKLALRLLSEYKHEVQVTLLKDILRAPNPATYVDQCIAKISDCAILMHQFIEDGCHGMILMGKDVYPVRLDTSKNWLRSDDKWTRDDEELIQNRLAEDWMIEHKKPSFNGKVVLFPQFGFSGIPNDIVMIATANVDGLERIQGTNFYVAPGTSTNPGM